MVTFHDILFLVLSLVDSLPQSQVKKENSPVRTMTYPDLLNTACYSIQSVIICAQAYDFAPPPRSTPFSKAAGVRTTLFVAGEANENVVFLQMRGSLQSSGH